MTSMLTRVMTRGIETDLLCARGSRACRMTVVLLLLLAAGRSAAAPRTGEGIVVGHVGRATARYPAGPVHEGRFETRDLFQGAAVGELTRLTTDKRGNLCMVLTPGALIHIPPETVVTTTRLQVTADGLPSREEDLLRRITLQLDQGRLYVNGGRPTPSLEILVQTDLGDVKANGGIFSIAREGDKGWSIVCEQDSIELIAQPGSQGHRLSAGETGWLTPSGISLVGIPDKDKHTFELCTGFFRDLEAFRHPTRGFDRRGLADYLGVRGMPMFIGGRGALADVSPSSRPVTVDRTATELPAGVVGPDGRRWGEERIWAWWDDIGIIRGVNYVPRNCVNSTEMWQEDTFDPDLIDEELGWAKRAGYTAVRVVLQQIVWQHDRDGFMERLDRFLDIAGDHGLAVVPVLFDDLNRAGRDAFYGPQLEPIPGAHNARWTPNPGPARVKDHTRWKELEDYARAVIGEYKRDRRILFWDLYNTAGNDGLWEHTLPLMDQVFNWARDINPRQPLAIAAWKDLSSPLTERQLERSDIINLQSFANPEMLEAQILLLKRHNRPILLIDWLMRQQDSTFQGVLPICSVHRVGWFNRGFVRGRTQTWIQETDFRSTDDPDLWQHDVLHPDGTAYDDEEIELIRAFRYLD